MKTIMEYEIIRTLSDYLKFVESLNTNFIISRGQIKNFPLLPSGLRKERDGNLRYSKSVLNSFVLDFESNAQLYIEQPLNIKNNYELMVVGQHYGLPTRLLDFTYSHLISLFFAIEDAFDPELKYSEYVDDEDNMWLDDIENYGVIWFLNPEKLNEIVSGEKKIISLHGIDNNALEQEEGPRVVKSRKTNARINNQNGTFVFFQNDSDKLEDYLNTEIARKVIIPNFVKKEIMSMMYSSGMSYRQIYPELDSVAKDIKLGYEINAYRKECVNNE